jgi:hypothetical protein
MKNQYNNNFKKIIYSNPSINFETDKLTSVVYNNISPFSQKLTTLPKYNSLDINKSILDNNVSLYLITNSYYQYTYNLNFFYSLQNTFKLTFVYLLDVFKRTIGDGFIYIRGLFIIFFIDACLTDDEPI